MMGTKRETRSLAVAELRVVPNSDGRQFEAMPCRYEVADDFGTVWTRGVFSESVEQRMPTLLWGHKWDSLANVLGRATDYTDTDDGPKFLYEFSDFDDVPMARQASSQLRSGHIDEFSVGFVRKVWDGPRGQQALDARTAEIPGALERMRQAELDETSLVVRGAVPRTGVLAFRDARGQVVPETALIDLAKRVADPDDELTVEAAKAALAILATDDETSGGGDGAGTDPPPEDPPPLTDADQAVLAEAESIIDDIGRSR